MAAPAAEHSPAYKIFHYYICCLVPASFANQGMNNAMGSIIYDTPSMERSAAADMIPKQHTVVEMAELSSRGARIILKTPKDSVRIYEWLRDHLNGMKNQMQFTINTAKVPIDDIRILDAFADDMYKIARQYEVVDTRNSSFFRQLDKMNQSRLRPKILKRKPGTPVKVKEHNSITSDINKLSMLRGLPVKPKQY